MARKLSKRQARKRVGMTQVELAKAAGVSRSTVQRAEKAGKTKNAKLQAIYDNIEKNRGISKEYKTLMKMVKRRLDKLEEAGLQNTPAYRNITSQGIPDLIELTKDPATAKRKLAKLQEMMDYQTIEVAGAKEWKQNVTEAATKTAGLEDYEEEEYGQSMEELLDIFYQVFNTLRNDRSYSKYWKGGYFDSGQARSDINHVINTGINSGVRITFDYVMEMLENLVQPSYDGRSRRGLF